MRQIAVINQKGGVGKTTTSVNLAAALASLGRRVVVVDMDPQANLSLHVDRVAPAGAPSVYTVLIGACTFEEAIFETTTPGLRIVPSNIDLSGAETELASAMGRETILGEAVNRWVSTCKDADGRSPADYVIFDCPPSLGLLALNALAAADEVLLTVQTEFLALQGMSKLVEIVQLVRQRLNDKLKITGILPTMYDTRLRLAREVLSEIRKYFPGQVFKQPIGTNVKLAEAPSFGETIFQYAPDSKGAQDYRAAALEVIAQESRDPELANLPRPEPDKKPVPKAKAPAKPPKKKPKPAVSKPNTAKEAAAKPATPKISTKNEQAKEIPATEIKASKAEPALRDKTITPPSKQPPVAPAETVTDSTPATKPSPPEQTAAPARTGIPTNTGPTKDASATRPAPAENLELRDEVITPPAPRTPEPAPETQPNEASAKRRSSKMLRAESLPPLPQDAFDNYLDSMQGY